MTDYSMIVLIILGGYWIPAWVGLIIWGFRWRARWRRYYKKDWKFINNLQENVKRMRDHETMGEALAWGMSLFFGPFMYIWLIKMIRERSYPSES